MTQPQHSPDDFASAAMMRLVHAGLARQSINPGTDRPRGAHVARGGKSDALNHLLEARGPLAILHIAEALPDLTHEPVLKALLLARDLEDLMARWARIETFSHKRHWIETEGIGPGAVRLRHRSRANGHAPSLAETLLVMGVLTLLAETALGGPARLELGEGAVWRSGGAWTERALPSEIEAAVLTCAAPKRAEDPPRIDPPSFAVPRLRDSLRSDPLRRWKIGDLARDMGLSVRSLQRKLAQESLSFSTLVSETRLDIASERLCQQDGPGLPEIGFLAGYSDQAHFNRAFKQAVGTTPGLYRSEFQAGA